MSFSTFVFTFFQPRASKAVDQNQEKSRKTFFLKTQYLQNPEEVLKAEFDKKNSTFDWSNSSLTSLECNFWRVDFICWPCDLTTKSEKPVR
jgi:hypothetical protein